MIESLNSQPSGLSRRLNRENMAVISIFLGIINIIMFSCAFCSIYIYCNSPILCSMLFGTISPFFAVTLFIVSTLFGTIFGIKGIKSKKRELAILGVVLNTLPILLVMISIILFICIFLSASSVDFF